MHTLGMKFVLHSSLLLFILSCSNDAIDHISSAAADYSSVPSECRRASTTARLIQLKSANDVIMKPKDEEDINHAVQLHSDSLHYIVQLNIVGKQRPLSLVLDTGSRMTITTTTQTTCINDLGSSWYSHISCNDTECSDLIIDMNNSCDQSETCDFELEYLYQDLGIGTLTKVNLTDFPGFLLWRGKDHLLGSSIDGIDGVLGLDKLSFASQGRHFSYCLPSNPSSTGYLTFAKNNTHHNLLFTPFANPPQQDGSLYFVDIVAITVGETRLQINYKSDIRGMVIQTRMQITQLPSAAYGKLRDEFKRQMGTNYPAAKAFSIMDTCYDTTDSSSITSSTVPHVSFTFGNNVTVRLDVSGILYVVNSTLSCLAFAKTSDPTGFAIFGSVQQRTLKMVFDVANGMLGFALNGCA